MGSSHRLSAASLEDDVITNRRISLTSMTSPDGSGFFSRLKSNDPTVTRTTDEDSAFRLPSFLSCRCRADVLIVNCGAETQKSAAK